MVDEDKERGYKLVRQIVGELDLKYEQCTPTNEILEELSKRYKDMSNEDKQAINALLRK